MTEKQILEEYIPMTQKQIKFLERIKLAHNFIIVVMVFGLTLSIGGTILLQIHHSFIIFLDSMIITYNIFAKFKKHKEIKHEKDKLDILEKRYKFLETVENQGNEFADLTSKLLSKQEDEDV